MPHIIVEYAEDLLGEEMIPQMLATIHSAITESGLFEESHIKTRAYAFKHYTQAGGDQPYVHIQARIKSGRDAINKKRLSEVLIARLGELSLSTSVLTVEIIDMDRASYGKIKFS